MTRISKRKMVAGLVVALGVADGVGIYVAHNKLGTSADFDAEEMAREIAVANEPLAEPIAIRADGGLKRAPVLAVAPSVAPQMTPVENEQRTVRVAIAEPVKAPAAAPVAPPAARQTAPVLTGRVAVAEKPGVRRSEPRRASELASNAARKEDLRVHQQRIPARVTRVERRPYQEDLFASAFGTPEAETRLPEPAYGYPDLQPRGQASAELPPLELSTSQIHSEPSGTSDGDAPPAPPATAASSDDIQPAS